MLKGVCAKWEGKIYSTKEPRKKRQMNDAFRLYVIASALPLNWKRPFCLLVVTLIFLVPRGADAFRGRFPASKRVQKCAERRAVALRLQAGQRSTSLNDSLSSSPSTDDDAVWKNIATAASYTFVKDAEDRLSAGQSKDFQVLKEAIDNISSEIKDLSKDFRALDDKVTKDFKALDEKVTKDFKALDEKVTNEIKDISKDFRAIDEKVTKLDTDFKRTQVIAFAILVFLVMSNPGLKDFVFSLIK